MGDKIVSTPLYHGTSTLFLEDILAVGLGGKDPIRELALLDFIAEIRPLIDSHLAGTQLYVTRAHTFALMAGQRPSPKGWNFQHGQPYLSPCRQTAIRYAANKRYGSELLTYTLDFLKELVDRDVPGVRRTLYQRYPRLFGLLDISPAPILVQADAVPTSSLLDEYGASPQTSLEHVESTIRDFPDLYEELLQQTNFRLIKPLAPERIRAFLINVTNWNPSDPQYVLYELHPNKHSESRCEPS